MANNELEAIGSLAPRFRQVLVDDLRITTCRDLVLTARPVIVAAMRAAKKRPPTLEQIAQWQDEARAYEPSRDAEAGTDDPWDRAATFVVCFQQRHRPGASEQRGSERRIEVEHTELEDDREAVTHRDGWSCDWVCGWMRERIGDLATAAMPARTTAARPARATRTAPARTPRTALTVDEASIIDRGGTHAVNLDRTAGGPLHAGTPAALRITVGGEPRPANARLAVQARTAGHRASRTIYDEPLADAASADVDLSMLSPGEHRVTIIAWDTHDAADPAILKLPTLHLTGAT